MLNVCDQSNLNKLSFTQISTNQSRNNQPYMLLLEIIIHQQMISQKLGVGKKSDNSSGLKLKIGITSKHLQALKQKLMYQSQKISTLKNTGSCDENPQLKDSINKRNKANNFVRSHHPLQDSMLEKKDRKGSDAHTMIQQYLSNKPPTLTKNKSQLFHGFKPQPRHECSRKLLYNLEGDRRQQETDTEQSSLTVQQINEQLKITTSTNTSSPCLLKTMEKIKHMTHSSQICPPGRARQKSELRITDFQILKYIQEGQFGAVFMARHIATNFVCALKKIPKKIFGGDMRYINQLVREIKIQSFLVHPNIIHLYSFFDDYDHVYLMMQYCSGGNLYASLKKQARFPEHRVKRYLRQICHAVQFMHDHDIIHRDIKPQNILLHQDMVKICDFGWSINSPLLRQTHCGTPLYSSPEMIEKKQYDSKVDIWNIGVMSYEFLYGKVPFEIRCEQDLIKIVQDDIYFSRHHPVSPVAKDFILKCLKKNPKERPPINKLLDHQFFHQ